MKPFDPGIKATQENVLTIDIPAQWEDTKPKGSVGPRFWARTGCRYDVASGRAQCETGGCGGKYDCSAAKLGASIGTTVAEWTFYEPVRSGNKSYFKDSPDISAVDGANLNMDIQPVGGSAHDPFDIPKISHDIQWLAEQYPLTQHGQDLRDVNRCPQDAFQLRRSDMTETAPNAKGKGIYAFVIVGEDGKPLGGDSTVACFSNCAAYAYPLAPKKTCNESDPNCYRWKSFCLNAADSVYEQKCNVDSDCPYGLGCWINPGSSLDKTCQGRAFNKKINCSPNVCTYPYGYKDTAVQPPITYYSTQPKFGKCTDVASDPKACIGDDTLHEVMQKAYTWPNDPQVYGGDAPLYRIVFSPGGTKTAITPTTEIPLCSKLPLIYGYSTYYGGPNSGTKPCDVPVNRDNAKFAVAHPRGSTKLWACNLSPNGSGDEGVICKWR